MADHIQIGDVAPRVAYTGDGITDAFTFPFPVFADGNLGVYVDAVEQEAGTDYGVTGAGQSAGGNVVFGAAPANGAAVLIIRDLTVARTSDFQASGEFRAKVINDELDYLTAVLQEINSELVRTVRLQRTDAPASLELPSAASRAEKFLTFDVDGNAVASMIADIAGVTVISGSTPAAGTAAGSAGVSGSLSAADHSHPLPGAADIGIASQSEAEAGTDNTRAMTPLRTAQAIAQLFEGIDPVARDMAASALAYALAANDASGIAGSVGKFRLADSFESDTLETSEGVVYDATGDYYHNPDDGTVTWSASLTGNDSGQADISYRQVIPAADISADGSTVTITCEASSAAALSVDNVSIVERSGTTANGAAVPTEVLFGGVSGFSIASGETITSDVTAFAIDETRDYLVIFDVSSSDGNPRRIDGAGECYSKSATDSFDQQSISGFSSSARTYIVNAITVDPVSDDMTLAPLPATLAAADPADVIGYFVMQPVDDIDFGSDVIGKVSIDGGTTNATGVWTLVGEIGTDGEELWRLEADVSAQSGSSLMYEITTVNNQQIRLHDCVGLIAIY